MTCLFPCVEGLILPTIDHDFWIKPDTFRVTNTHSKSVQPNNVSFVDIPRHFYLFVLESVKSSACHKSVIPTKI